MEHDNKVNEAKTPKTGPYVIVSEKIFLSKRDPATGRFYSVKNDGSLWERPTLEDAIAMGPLLDRLRDYDRGK